MIDAIIYCNIFFIPQVCRPRARNFEGIDGKRHTKRGKMSQNGLGLIKWTPTSVYMMLKTGVEVFVIPG